MKVDLLVYFCMRRWSLLDRVQCADHCNHLNYNLLNNVIFSTTNEHTLKKKIVKKKSNARAHNLVLHSF